MSVKDTAYPSSLEEGEIGNDCYHGGEGILPCARENLGCSGPATPVGAMAKDLCHNTTEPLWVLPNKHLGSVTS